jgi:hypothetical protein
MTIQYPDGKTIKAALLDRDDRWIRAAFEFADDVIELRQVGGKWIGENGEAVEVEFEWQRCKRTETPQESDCVCSADLARKLAQLLSAEDDG